MPYNFKITKKNFPMSCIPAWKQTLIEAKIAAKEAQLSEYYTAILSAIPNSEISEYEFESGEGRQKVKRRAPSSIQSMISQLEAEIDFLYRQLNGYGLASFKGRRYF